MKSILKKNQVIIAALAIMIAVAGYLTFTGDKINNQDGAIVTAGENGTMLNGENQGTNLAGDSVAPNVDTETTDSDGVLKEDETEITDAQGTEKENLTATVGDDNQVVTDQTGKTDQADQTDQTDQTGSSVGDAVLASSTISASYFSSVKLDREQTRAKNKEMLQEIIDNDKIDQEQKQDAINKIIEYTDRADKESATEIMLKAKGFADAVVNMSDNGVDVIVNANNLTEQQIAQIEYIVKNRTELSAKNVAIHPVKVTEDGKVVDSSTGAEVSGTESE